MIQLRVSLTATPLSLKCVRTIAAPCRSAQVTKCTSVLKTSWRRLTEPKCLSSSNSSSIKCRWIARVARTMQAQAIKIHSTRRWWLMMGSKAREVNLVTRECRANGVVSVLTVKVEAICRYKVSRTSNTWLKRDPYPIWSWHSRATLTSLCLDKVAQP